MTSNIEYCAYIKVRMYKHTIRYVKFNDVQLRLGAYIQCHDAQNTISVYIKFRVYKPLISAICIVGIPV